MKIKILLFAQLKEAYGQSHLWIDVPAPAKVQDAVGIVMKESTLGKYSALPLRYAVNEDFQPAEGLLKENDCLALLSPMAGG